MSSLHLHQYQGLVVTKGIRSVTPKQTSCQFQPVEDRISRRALISVPGEHCPVLEPLQRLIARTNAAVELLGLAQDGVLLLVVMFSEVQLITVLS